MDFNEIYLTMQDRVFRLAWGITCSREDAEDVVQDLYERLWPRRASVIGHRNPPGYIMTAARNLCLDRLRVRKPTVEVSSSMSAEGSGIGEDARDMERIVRRLMEALPEKQRTVMHLREIECMEIDEISGVMGMKGEAVRVSLSRARNTVKQQLEKIMNYGT